MISLEKKTKTDSHILNQFPFNNLIVSHNISNLYITRTRYTKRLNIHNQYYKLIKNKLIIPSFINK
jgi:hypothetical protein